ncbi:dienelactone hydrolase family protein [Phenylobacterium soli]|uniref:Dienelactone hydrolase family protein n=1 Tax=Phenylobacterium soli TaxID=2170551 RepID=A0A328AEX7_9CAUL|nr:dienelactone hydrolase family protein [Phenylobacterium soli]RAK53282.1 dienelactone hydrolase family protein [Phenylobacterium soli]
MCDDEIHQSQQLDQNLTHDPRLSRRGFGLAAAALAGYATTAEAQAAAVVVETDVSVKTPDGVADAVLFTPPGKGPYPGVLIWTDIGGLRPVFRDMGRRLAAAGYVVLVPNPFYRSQKAPVIEGPLNFGDPAVRQRLFAMRGAMTNEGIDKDATAYVGFLDAQAKVNRKAKIGVQGYCMGGPLTLRTGAASARIGAGATFHGGTLVTKTADSPHLLAPKLHGEYLVCEADNDDKSDPAAKDTVRAAFAAAKVPLKLEVYEGAMHGWCVPGAAVYNAAAAEKAWSELLALYKRALG